MRRHVRNPSWRSGLIAFLLLAANSGLAQSDTAALEALRAEFVAAYALARAGATTPATDSDSDSRSNTDSEALQSYALYPYLEAARLGSALRTAPVGVEAAADAAVAHFLLRNEGEPVSVNLRVAWLQSLAARQLWPGFLEHYRAEVADTALRCRQLSARIATGATGGIAPAILDEWLTPYQLPAECEPVFEWLRDAGLLDENATAARVRLLLENGQAGFARIIARRLPAARAAPLLLWADLIERPFATIRAQIASPAEIMEPRMLLDGWSRLARDQPDAALELYEELLASPLIESGARGPYTLNLALGLAWDRRAETLAVFARVPAALLDDYALGWQARAALWAGETGIARSAIDAMSAAQRESSQWRYWAARLHESSAEADLLYEALLPEDNFFAALAAAQLRDRVSIHPVTHARDENLLADLATRPALVRARELRLVGLPVASAREWSAAFAGLPREARAQGVHLAAGFGWYELAVATATEHGIFFDYPLLFPQPYAEAVEAAAEEFRLEPSLIYAVMRQESLYRVDAESAAGAFGLMQLQRGTARDVSRQLGGPDSPDLLDPAQNIRLGAARLASLIEAYDGRIVLALAAYNAGPAAVNRWLPDAPMAGDIWLENIPYNETREYVRRVLWSSAVFRRLDGERVDAREWMREIGR